MVHLALVLALLGLCALAGCGGDEEPSKPAPARDRSVQPAQPEPAPGADHGDREDGAAVRRQKYLVDRRGKVVARFGAGADPDGAELTERLERLLVLAG